MSHQIQIQDSLAYITSKPITDVTSNYLACNGGPNPTTATSKVINVAAGSTVQLVKFVIKRYIFL
jgi:phosphoglucomutase